MNKAIDHEYHEKVMSALRCDTEDTLNFLRPYLEQRQSLVRSELFDENLPACKGMLLSLNDYIKQIVGL